MIKVALKHWIYEVCIEQMFAGIFKNFNSPLMNKLRIGDKFNRIIIKVNSIALRVYTEVEVTGKVGDAYTFAAKTRSCWKKTRSCYGNKRTTATFQGVEYSSFEYEKILSDEFRVIAALDTIVYFSPTFGGQNGERLGAN